MSYYQNSVTINAEGDTSISDETLEGLGRTPNFLEALFGAIIQLAQPPKAKSTARIFESTATSATTSEDTEPVVEGVFVPIFVDAAAQVGSAMASTFEAANETLYQENASIDKRKIMLTEILPDPGYFAAGAVAGVISRTSTAPLDRLKVYLIANVKGASRSSGAVKNGNPVVAVKHLGQPLVDAMKDLWKAGGMRSLFAGEHVLSIMTKNLLT